MNPFRGLVRSSTATKGLERRYLWISSGVGFLGVAVGIVLVFFAVNPLSTFLGVDPHLPTRTQPNGTLWLVALLACFVLAIYAGCVLVAGVFAMIMVRLGKFTAREALHYALFSRCPESWFKK